MPHIKKARVSIRIDMTPMVDVAFLLLTFFMLTTSFRPPEEVEITLPISHSEAKLPESKTMTIHISSSGKIFLGFDSSILMEQIHGQQNRLRQAVEVKMENLADLLMKARIADTQLRTIVKADAGADYGSVSDVMDILQKTLITRFAMVTNYSNK